MEIKAQENSTVGSNPSELYSKALERLEVPCSLPEDQRLASHREFLFLDFAKEIVYKLSIRAIPISKARTQHDYFHPSHWGDRLHWTTRR